MEGLGCPLRLGSWVASLDLFELQVLAFDALEVAASLAPLTNLEFLVRQ